MKLSDHHSFGLEVSQKYSVVDYLLSGKLSIPDYYDRNLYAYFEMGK